MHSQLTNSLLSRPGPVPCLAGLALFVLLGQAGAAAAQLSCPLGSSVTWAMELLESVILIAAEQFLQAFVFGHESLVNGFARISISLAMLLFAMAAALLLREKLRG
jgi:hypothetical protein